MKKLDIKQVRSEELHKKARSKSHQQKYEIDNQMNKVMHSTEKSLSEGASQIARIQKTRSAWGSKQLWGSHEKGKNKPGHKTPKKSHEE